jgi:hypothetical protein
MEKGICISCGCTDEDCSGCIEKTGSPCSWVTPNLCSACAIVLYDGKYIFFKVGPWARCLRHGEPWPVMDKQLKFSNAITVLVEESLRMKSELCSNAGIR